MFKRKNKNYRVKYKPDNWIYIVITIICAIIRCVPISCGSASLDDAFNDLAVGAIASTLVAWLIDFANCGRKNQELAEKERMVFAEYCGAVNNIGYFVAKRCKRFTKATDEYELEDWLEKLRDNRNYPTKISPAATMERAYFHIASYVQNVKSNLLSLRQQYCMLVEADIIDGKIKGGKPIKQIGPDGKKRSPLIRKHGKKITAVMMVIEVVLMSILTGLITFVDMGIISKEFISSRIFFSEHIENPLVMTAFLWILMGFAIILTFRILRDAFMIGIPVKLKSFGNNDDL